MTARPRGAQPAPTSTKEGERPGLEYRSSVCQQEEGESKLLAGKELEMPPTACVEEWLHSQLTMVTV